MHLSSRQAEVIELVAAGLSDKEIGRQLGLSRRTVRTHLENLFHKHGLRSRAGAVALWIRCSSAPPESRPIDECRYPKPFSEDFDECPAYQPRQVTELDLSYRPLERSWTCRHLAGKRVRGADHRWYGACAVGDARARERWAAAVGSERLGKIAALQQEFAAVGAPYTQSLWQLKGQQLRAIHSSGDPSASTEAMRQLVRRLLTDVRAFVEARRDVLEDVHLPPDACMELIRVALDHLIEHDSVDPTWEIPENVLSQFPEDAQLFLRPGCLTGRVPTASALGSAPRPLITLLPGLA